MNRDNLAGIDGPLARNPRDIAALIAKADHLAGGGELRAASACYLRAVRLASALLLPAQLRAEVARAQAATRVVLLFELWRPEITQAERRLISTLFEAVDAQGGGRVAWSV